MSLQCLYRFALDDLALSVRYHPQRAGVLCAGAANGKLWVFSHALEDLRGDEGQRTLRAAGCKQLAPDAMLYGLDWTCDGGLCIAATSAQRLFVEDVERGTTLLALRGHQSSVKTVRACPFNAQLALSGGRDGQALLFDLRAEPEPVLVVARDRERITGTEFHGDERLALTGCVGAAAVEAWDLRKTLTFTRSSRSFAEKRSSHLLLRLHGELHLESALCEVYRQVRDEGGVAPPQLLTAYHRLRASVERLPVPAAKDGVIALLAAQRSSSVFCSLLSHRVLAFDCENALFLPPRQFGGFHANMLSRCSLDPSEAFLAQGSGCGLCFWRVADGPATGEQPHVHPHAHALEVNCVDFSPAGQMVLSSVSDDCQGRVWRFAPVTA